MKLLFIADGRSPIALNWIRYFVEDGHEVHLVSLNACSPDLQLASLEVIPIAFGQPLVKTSAVTGAVDNPISLVGSLATPRLRTVLRQWIVPLRLPGAADRIRQLAVRIGPDLIHAMRVPYEGMAAALAEPSAPLLVSIWGNDFTLHARSTPFMSRLTRKTMNRTNALHTDCQRDARLARDWGYPADRPLAVLPSGGGVQGEIFFPLPSQEALPPRVINPRGLRAYVRNDTFFQAVPRILASYPETRFICPGMAGELAALRWLERYGGQDAVDLLPRQTREGMADLFRRSQVAVSITTHDGTPNTLLEALACGCYPVAGDLESIREWISPGVNGTLVDPGSAEDLATAVLGALKDPAHRRAASEYNVTLVGEKADYRRVMNQAEQYYWEVIES